MAASANAIWARKRTQGIGLAVLALFAGCLWLALIAKNGLPGASRRQVEVAFANVGGLATGDDVRIADVRVGQVSAINLQDGRPVVTLSLDGNRAVYRNATATIAQRSALGANYVDLTPGAAATGMLAPGQLIEAPASASAQDLSNLLDVLNARTRAALSSTVQEVGAGSAGHGQDLHAALSALPGELGDLSSISRSLSTGDGADLSDLLSATRDLSDSFAGQQAQLSGLISQLSATVAAVGTDGGQPLAQSLSVAPTALDSARTALAALQDPLVHTTNALSLLRPGLSALGAATPNLRGLLREAVQPFNKVPSVAGEAKAPIGKLTAFITDARPLAPAIVEALKNASTPLAVLAPYAADVSSFFTNITSSLQQGDAAGHWLRFYPVVDTQSVDGLLPVTDPASPSDPYPATGQAETERNGR
jgi:phospholipid/cholesterol/gamma-HCH transport system substrate-binding protein